jgi:hypothetical protein
MATTGAAGGTTTGSLTPTDQSLLNQLNTQHAQQFAAMVAFAGSEEKFQTESEVPILEKTDAANLTK